VRKGALFAVLLLLGCAGRHDGIVGHWKSDPHPTQLGLSSEDLCLRRDGTCSMRARTSAGTLRNRGRYELRGTMLRFFVKGSVAEEEEIELRGDTLVTREKGSGLTLHYRRQRMPCLWW
jgi:hypothetical protein